MIKIAYYLFLYPVLAGCFVELLLRQPLKMRTRYWWEGVLWEFASLWGVLCLGKLVRWELAGVYGIYRVVSLAVTILAIGWIVKAGIQGGKQKRQKKETAPMERDWKAITAAVLLAFIFIGLIGLQISRNGAVQEKYSEDRMAIYINTILEDGNLRVTNPMTGLPYYEGQAVVRYPVYTVFYALIGYLFPGNTLTLVYKIIPVWLLCLFYSMQYGIGLELLGGKKWKGLLYGIAVCVLNIFGAAKQWIWGSFLMLYPWTNDSIRVCIMIPAVIWLLVKFVAAVMRGAEHERAD